MLENSKREALITTIHDYAVASADNDDDGEQNAEKSRSKNYEV